MNVLVVKANNRPDGISTKMYDTFMENVQGVDVTTFDVFAEDMPYFGQDLFNAFGKVQNGEALTDVESRLLAAKQKAMDALTAANVVVFAFPLWNLTIPAKLQTFIDYVFQAGYTFKYNENGQLEGLMGDKKVVILNARGGYYSSPEARPMEMSVNYIKNVVGMFGMEIIEEVIIEGHNASQDKAQEIIANGLEAVKKVAQSLQTVNA
ncbi:FMN-dependent NADH-azoreductase [Lysinibacillus xylanilyticus]|uniref:FMN dependent NADH:quinone oxidoreductase n=1 Tax=Lysinibacillus xylanilyticus TaxID=582475 RepID=A0A2M9Q8S0_9BACI|nr:FMN-dependent NADH-azoreductase [Lysinibacillus xylanilyticus]MCY9548577.1 FMN-dependent NADH-azoreductase [Lysinibacillus xylanilyticus]MED3800558.1 FMN-dependent NADH-azoreductase [Lysinibacillus xylanilyticus]PJO44470.1 FMN-dependent NADH-azoreductase [Lysinibacillus xylanilyticus]